MRPVRPVTFATEDLVLMLERMGVRTGVNVNALVDAGLLAQSILGRELPGRALRAFAAERQAASCELDT